MHKHISTWLSVYNPLSYWWSMEMEMEDEELAFSSENKPETQP